MRRGEDILRGRKEKRRKHFKIRKRLKETSNPNSGRKKALEKLCL